MSNASLYDYLREYVRSHDVRQYLEIGTRDGGSLRVVLEEGTDTLQSVWVADMWGTDYGGSGRGDHRHIDQLFDDFNYAGRRVFLDGNSRDTIPALMPQKAEFFDLVLVDGDHSYEGGRADLENVWPLVKPGGVIVFHDITHPLHPYLMRCFQEFVEARHAPYQTITADYGLGVAWKR